MVIPVVGTLNIVWNPAYIKTIPIIITTRTTAIFAPVELDDFRGIWVGP